MNKESGFGSPKDQSISISPQNNVELDTVQKRRAIRFRTNEADWREKSNAKQVEQEILAEYNSASPEIRILSEATDATVMATYHRMILQAEYPQNFLSVRPLGDNSVNLKAMYEHANENDELHDQVLHGYHHHGRDAQAVSLVRAIETIETLDQIGKDKEFSKDEVKDLILESAHKAMEFKELSSDDIVDILQYSTTFVAVVADGYWKRFLSRAAAGYVSGGSYLFVPESELGKPGADVALFHEYSHMIDEKLNNNWSSKEKEEVKKDEMIAGLKSEFNAFLAAYTVDPSVTIKDIVQMLRISYLPKFIQIFGPDSERKFNSFTSAVVKVPPYIIGLLLEMGEDPNNHQLVNLTLRSFISCLPDREISSRILEDSVKTGVYAEGLQHSA